MNHPPSSVLSLDAKRQLTGIICSYLKDHEVKVGLQLAEPLSQQIIKCYPLENKATYFDPQTKTGSLVSKSSYLFRQSKRNAISNKSSVSKKQKLSEESSSSQQNYSKEELVCEEYVRTHHNEADFPALMIQWSQCFQYRQFKVKSLDDLTTTYKIYQRPEGYQLVIFFCIVKV